MFDTDFTSFLLRGTIDLLRWLFLAWWHEKLCHKLIIHRLQLFIFTLLVLFDETVMWKYTVIEDVFSLCKEIYFRIFVTTKCVAVLSSKIFGCLLMRRMKQSIFHTFPSMRSKKSLDDLRWRGPSDKIHFLRYSVSDHILCFSQYESLGDFFTIYFAIDAWLLLRDCHDIWHAHPRIEREYFSGKFRIEVNDYCNVCKNIEWKWGRLIK